MSRIKIGDRERINFYFDRNILEALKKIAMLKNTSYSELIRVAAREYILREGPKALADQSLIKDVQNDA